MMTTPRRHVGEAAITILFVCLATIATTTGASARSVLTDTFVATVSSATRTLETADAAAVDAATRRQRAFAVRDDRVETATTEALARWARGEIAAGNAAAAAPSIDHLGPVIHAFDPGDPVGLDAPPSPVEQDALRRLPTLQGDAFDALYLATARPALLRLEATYKDYILNGDDVALRTIAVRELPKVEGLLAALGRD